MTKSRWVARSLPLSVTVATVDVLTIVTGGMVKVVEEVVAKVEQVLVSYSEASQRISKAIETNAKISSLTSGRNAKGRAKGDKKPHDQQHRAVWCAVWSIEVL